jgi:ketosteroid isomerase-like protein
MSTSENKDLVRAFVDAWNTKNLDAIDDLMSETCELTVSGTTISASPAATRVIAEHWLAGFPDYRFDLTGPDRRRRQGGRPNTVLRHPNWASPGPDTHRPGGARRRDRDLPHR